MPWRGNWPDSSGRLGEDNRHINRSTPILRAFAAGTGTRADEGEPSAQLGDKSPRRTRVLRTRQLPTDHCHAVRTITRAYQHDHRRDPLVPVPPQKEVQEQRAKTKTTIFTLDRSTHISCGPRGTLLCPAAQDLQHPRNSIKRKPKEPSASTVC